MAYTDLKKHLPDLRAKRLLLTHLDDEMLREKDGIPEACAEDGMVIVL